MQELTAPLKSYVPGQTYFLTDTIPGRSDLKRTVLYHAVNWTVLNTVVSFSVYHPVRVDYLTHYRDAYRDEFGIWPGSDSKDAIRGFMEQSKHTRLLASVSDFNYSPMLFVKGPKGVESIFVECKVFDHEKARSECQAN